MGSSFFLSGPTFLLNQTHIEDPADNPESFVGKMKHGELKWKTDQHTVPGVSPLGLSRVTHLDSQRARARALNSQVCTLPWVNSERPGLDVILIGVL